MPDFETDYLVVGSGAVGMAFADTLLDESDAHVTIVDRHGKPGGLRTSYCLLNGRLDPICSKMGSKWIWTLCCQKRWHILGRSTRLPPSSLITRHRLVRCRSWVTR